MKAAWQPPAAAAEFASASLSVATGLTVSVAQAGASSSMGAGSSSMDAGSSADVPSPIRCRGGGATPPAEPGSPEQVVNELAVAAEIQRLLHNTRKRKLEIVERNTLGTLEAAWLGTEQTSWERESAPSPSSWNPAATDHDEASRDDEALEISESAGRALDESDQLEPVASVDLQQRPAAVSDGPRVTRSRTDDTVLS